VHEPAPFFSRQTAFAPHGDGLHGSLGPSVGAIQKHKRTTIINFNNRAENVKRYNNIRGTLLCCTIEHPANGSPVYPVSHVHCGL